jgi:hypothetical protein
LPHNRAARFRGYGIGRRFQRKVRLARLGG